MGSGVVCCAWVRQKRNRKVRGNKMAKCLLPYWDIRLDQNFSKHRVLNVSLLYLFFQPQPLSTSQWTLLSLILPLTKLGGPTHLSHLGSVCQQTGYPSPKHRLPSILWVDSAYCELTYPCSSFLFRMMMTRQDTSSHLHGTSVILHGNLSRQRNQSLPKSSLLLNTTDNLSKKLNSGCRSQRNVLGEFGQGCRCSRLLFTLSRIIFLDRVCHSGKSSLCHITALLITFSQRY